MKPGAKQIKTWPCIICNKTFAKHSHNGILRCMSTLSYRYIRMIEEIKQEAIRQSKEGVEERNVNAEENIELTKKEAEPSLDVKTGENIKVI